MSENEIENRTWITLNSEQEEYSLVPGGSTVIKMRVRNQGLEKDYIEIGVRGIPGSWVTLSTQVVHLSPGEEIEVTLTVQPPSPPQAQAGIYSLIVVAISQQDAERAAQAEVLLRVAVFDTRGRIGVMMESVQFVVAPDSTTTIPILLLNQGLQTDKFSLRVDGIPVNWVSTASPVTSLEPGERKAIQLHIHPPRHPSSKAGRNPFKVLIVSELVPEEYVEVNCILTIAAYWGYQVGLEPDQVWAGATVQVVVANQGNTDNSFSLSWQSSKNDLIFEAARSNVTEDQLPSEIQPEHQNYGLDSQTDMEFFPMQDINNLRVPPGKAESVLFRAKPARQALFGGETSHEYMVFVEPVNKSNTESQMVKGQVISRAFLPPWVLTVAVTLFVMLACSVVFLTAQAWNRNISATQTAVYSIAGGVAATQTVSANQTEEAASGQSPTPPPTQDPLTPVPPTEVPPTAVPPTEVPPTAIPPTAVQPTETVQPTPESTALPSLPGVIAFASDRDGNFEIYTQNGSNWNTSRLTNDPAMDTQPVWSPNGNRIAFTTNRDGNNEIYVMDGDGSNLINISNDSGDDQFPTWSPDSRKVAFASNRNGSWDVYSVGLDGSGLTNLTNSPSDDLHPYWFRSSGLISRGEQIVFTTNRDGNNEIYSMNPDGTGLLNLTKHPASDTSPSVSKSGRMIAFVTDREGNRDIYLMDVNGDSLSKLVNSPADETNPSWSPDDNWIAFSSSQANREIFVIRSNGTQLINFSNHPASDDHPSWR
jgi:hypothetical protein